ncbi:MAG: hypothetical protein H5T98_09630 [Syntrophomonadaceae bacterium]|nr:hypothetical protein [Syntrophomonadaceae bacterium]
MTSKRCYICGEEKPLEEFGKRSSALDGRRGDCLECRKARGYKITPSKKAEAAEVLRKQRLVLDAIGTGRMMMADILAHIGDQGVSFNTIGYMIRRGMLIAHATDKRTAHCNILYEYSVATGEPDKPAEAKRFLLDEVWPLPFPLPVGVVSRRNYLK